VSGRSKPLPIKARTAFWEERNEKTDFDIDERESEFGQLLQNVLADRAPMDVLFEDEIFKNRLRLITMAYARTEQGAEDLARFV
jgi:hypothetical protein